MRGLTVPLACGLLGAMASHAQTAEHLEHRRPDDRAGWARADAARCEVRF